MIDSVFIIGKSGSGKTDMANFQMSLLTESGFAPYFISDRLGLEEKVLSDVGYKGSVGEEGLVGLHSKLIADGPPGHRQIHVLDGLLLNRVHEQMVTFAAEKKPPGTILLAEYAIGPDISFGEGKAPLLQSARHFVRHLLEFGVMHRTLVVDVEASLPVRSERNSRRLDGLAPETFQAYFPDGGEMDADLVHQLGIRYQRLDNGFHDASRFSEEAKQLYFQFICPQLEREGFPSGYYR